MQEKIKKLLALANHPNTDPNEAAAAAAMAARLAAQYNIDLASFEQTASREFIRDTLDIRFAPRDDQARVWLVSAVSQMYACRVFTVLDGTARRVMFVGAPHNVDLCKSWTKYLWESCKRANTEHAREADYGSRELREEARSSFRFGFCLTVHKRINEEIQKMRTHGLPESGSTALVVVNYFDREIAEISSWVEKNMELGKRAPSRKVQVNASAFTSGKQAGDRVALNKQLT